jgi:glycosyltransferase involved in cell wall biosynthesis
MCFRGGSRPDEAPIPAAQPARTMLQLPPRADAVRAGRTVRIGIDTRSLEDPRPTGVARYLRGILREFGGWHADNEFILYSRATLGDGFLAVPPFRQVHIGANRHINDSVWGNVLLPRAAGSDHLDVLFGPAYVVPLAAAVKRVVVIHDISFQVHPEWFGVRDRVALRTASRWSARVAQAIVTDSRFQKREILEHYRIPAERVAAIPLAVGEQFNPGQTPELIAAIQRKYRIPGPYVLHVGAVFARRNLPVLLRAFAHIAGEIPHTLVVVGPNRTVPHVDLEAMAQRLGVRDRTVFVEFADDEDMAPLYAGAQVSACISSYEGFGLPALESLACGTPVVAADATSIPEVVGRAGILVDPTDPEAVAEALRRVLTNEGLRRQLRTLCLQRAAMFSWRQTAQATMGLLERVAASPSGHCGESQDQRTARSLQRAGRPH